MKKLISGLCLCVLPILAHADEFPTLAPDTKILHIPVLEYRSGETTLYIKADLQGSANFSAFTLANAATINPPNGDVVEGISGAYEGVLAAYTHGTREKIGPFLSCPKLPFNAGSADVEIAVVGPQIQMKVGVFSGPICELTGTSTGSSASGSFQCSDFNRGKWSSSMIKLQDNGNILTMNINYVGDRCSFDTNFTGIK